MNTYALTLNKVHKLRLYGYVPVDEITAGLINKLEMVVIYPFAVDLPGIAYFVHITCIGLKPLS